MEFLNQLGRLGPLGTPQCQKLNAFDFGAPHVV